MPTGQSPSRCAAALASGALAGAALLWSVACTQPEPPPPPPPVVQIVEIAATQVPLTAEFIGQLDSPENVEIRARVEGFVEKALFQEGTEVKAGDPLFTLDEKPFRERLAGAEGRLAEAKAARNKADKDVARLQPLADKRAIPRQDLDNALAAVDVAAAAVQSAEAMVASAKLDLGYCDIRAPLAGLIGAKQVAIGDLVGRGLPTLLATISILDPIWFYGNVSEVAYLEGERQARQTGKRIADLPVTLLLADGSEHPNPGKFVFLDRAVDPRTGTMRVRAEFANPERLLRPGMFARIRVQLRVIDGGILVPQRAVQELQGKNFVWVIDAEQTASQRAVTAGARIGADWLIEDGLKPGERVVVEGVHKLRQGTKVQPAAPEQGGAN